MAKNPKKVVSFTDEDGTKYPLRLDFNVLCELEGIGYTLDEAVAIMQGAKPAEVEGREPLYQMQMIRFLMCEMMRETKPDLTDREAGRIMSVDGIGNAINTLQEAINVAFPEAAEENASGNGEAGKAA